MCGFCAAFGGEDHWTASAVDRKQARATARFRLRAHRLALVNRVLAIQRLHLTDFHNSCYVVASPTGKREIVHDLGAVWAAAEGMTGRPLDPLDPATLKALGQHTDAS